MEISEILNFYLSKGDELINSFKNEKQLQILDKDENIVIIGDLHGDLNTLNKVLSQYSPNDHYLIFLGDYVDRGEYQIEVLTGVLQLKLQYPDRVILLRGNHESPFMNNTYGFVYEVERKLSSAGLFIYGEFITKIFANLPYAVLLNNEIFMVHGGLANELKKPEDVNSIPKDDKIPRNRLAFEILWNDPNDEIEGFIPNFMRGGDPYAGIHIYYWGPDVTNKFLSENSLKLIIRAHEYFENGYKWYHDNKVLTIFSSCAGPYKFVKPKIVIYHKGEIKIKDV